MYIVVLGTGSSYGENIPAIVKKVYKIVGKD